MKQFRLCLQFSIYPNLEGVKIYLNRTWKWERELKQTYINRHNFRDLRGDCDLRVFNAFGLPGHAYGVWTVMRQVSSLSQFALEQTGIIFLQILPPPSLSISS